MVHGDSCPMWGDTGNNPNSSRWVVATGLWLSLFVEEIFPTVWKAAVTGWRWQGNSSFGSPAVTGWRWQGNSSFGSPPPLGAREQQPVSLLTLPEDPLLWTPDLAESFRVALLCRSRYFGRSPSWPCVWWHHVRVYHDSCQRKLPVSPKIFLISHNSHWPHPSFPLLSHCTGVLISLSSCKIIKTM